ncbi:MAG: putative ABC transporter permease [Clostridia bacterium]|nr:putative ABC transporter permease [Clostridia bacterium]
MDALFEYLFLFCLCATAGWILEFVYRGIRHRKVINPGFLTGCCLPLYGAGGCILYFLSEMKLRALPYEWMRHAVILLLGALVMTLIELIGGFIALKIFRVRLWDYSGEWANLHGLICPKFSLFWTLICALFHFGIYPFLHEIAVQVVEQPLMILALGTYTGIFLVDLFQSLRLMQRLKDYAKQLRTHIHLDHIKATAREYFYRETGARRKPFNFYNMVSRYLLDEGGYRQEIRNKWGDNK